MKNLILIAVAMMATSAHASTLLCNTQPGPTGAQYGVSIVTDESGETMAHVRLNGGRAHFILIVGDYPVTIGHEGPEVAVFTSSADNEFELTVNYQRFGGDPFFHGELKLNAPGHELDKPVRCHAL